MIILGFIKFVVFVSILAFSSWQFLRKILKQNEVYILLPLSVILSISTFVFVSNILGYFVPITTSFVVVLVALLLSGLFFLKKNPGGPLCLGLSKKHLVYIVVATVLLALMSWMVLYSNQTLDEGVHRTYAVSILNGNFPPKDPLNPGYAMQYHYGFEVLLAATSYFSGLPVQFALDVVMALLTAFIFLMVFSFAYFITKNHRIGFLSAWLFYFGGGFRYLTVFQHLDYSYTYVTDYLKQIIDIFLSTAPDSMILGPGYFHSYTIDNFGFYMYHTPSLISTAVVLIVFWLFAERERSVSNKTAINVLLGLLIGLSALMDESRFILLVAALGVFGLYKLLKAGDFSRNSLKVFFTDYGVVIFLASIVAAFQGGVLTDLVAKSMHLGHLKFINSLSGGGDLSLRMIPGLNPDYVKFYPLNSLYSWQIFLMEWGLMLILFPLAAYRLWKKGDAVFKFLILFTTISYFITLFVNYSLQPQIFSRFASVGYSLSSIIVGALLIDWMKDVVWRKRVVFILILAMSFSLVMFSLKALPAKIEPHILFNQEEISISKKAQEMIPRNAVVLGYDAYKTVELFGTYAYETDTKIWNAGSDQFIDRLNQMNISDLKERGIGYIYYDPLVREKIGDSFFLKNSGSLENIYSVGDTYSIYKLK